MASSRSTTGEVIYYPFRSSQKSKVLASGLHPTENIPWCYNYSPKVFNKWLQMEVMFGTRKFKQACGRALNQVTRLMQQDMGLSVKEVVKGGSLGKGTMLKGISDIDCVVLINSPDVPYLRDVSNMSTYVERDLANANKQIGAAIKKHAIRMKRNDYMVKATIEVSGVTVDVDLIPTADNLKAGKKSKKYEPMFDRTEEEREFYSPSLVKRQIDFVVRRRARPNGVKEVIRLVKYWNSQVVGSVLKDKRPLPTSYPMELITILAWERAGSPKTFNRLQGFKAVLLIIATDLPTLEKYWTWFYDESMVERAHRAMSDDTKRRPFLLDP